MERLCFTFEIRPGTEHEYKRRHDEIWPDLVEAIQDAGIGNYTLFRRGTTVVGYAECEPDAATAFAELGPSEVNQRWAKWFEEIIVSLVDEEGNLIRLDEVWHLD
jgi:L-rhamnose mutarotase